MKLSSINKKFEKAGYNVTTYDCHGSTTYHVVSNDGAREAEWSVNGRDGETDHVCSISTKSTSNHSDPYSDYCAWSFSYTIVSAVNYISRNDSTPAEGAERKEREARAARQAELDEQAATIARRRQAARDRFDAERDAKRLAADPSEGVRVRFVWSESNRIADGMVCTLSAAEGMIAKATIGRTETLGYDKTQFEILVDGESVYTGRFDVGCRHAAGSIVDHIEQYTEYLCGLETVDLVAVKARRQLVRALRVA
jgi:hypothetical protein